MVEKGYVKLQELQEAIRLRILSKKALGMNHSIGTILFLRGSLTLDKLRQVQTEVEMMNTLELKSQSTLGEVLVELGFITPNQLFESLDFQATSRRSGAPPRLLGEILMQKGYLTQQQLEAGLKALFKLNLKKIGSERQGRKP